MKYLFKDYPRDVARQIVFNDDTKLYYMLKDMERLVSILEWVENMKEEYPSFCFYPEDFQVDIVFRACKNLKDDIHLSQLTFKEDPPFEEFGFGININHIYLSLKEGNRIDLCDTMWSNFYFSNEEDRNRWAINNTEED